MERTRPVRNRRNSRKTWSSDTHRPIKKLFTPEIKRMLKEWLVRRRDNPYPSREEKKTLALEAGLTYTQICNWFANWRRKLKGASQEENRRTWTNLIKSYNTSAKGNVEQFSICSSDSIWEENEDLRKNDDVDGLVEKQKTEKVTKRRQKKNSTGNTNGNPKFGDFIRSSKINNTKKNGAQKKNQPEPLCGSVFEHFYVPKTFSNMVYQQEMTNVRVTLLNLLS